MSSLFSVSNAASSTVGFEEGEDDTSSFCNVLTVSASAFSDEVMLDFSDGSVVDISLETSAVALVAVVCAASSSQIGLVSKPPELRREPSTKTTKKLIY